MDNQHNLNTDIDYTNMVMVDLVDLLISHKNPWPSNYTKRMKTMFLDKIISYLTETEQYEQCAKINVLRDKTIQGK